MSGPDPYEEHPPARSGEQDEGPPAGTARPVTPMGPVSPATLEALAAQAHALEGVRRLHVDLAERLAAGEALRSRVDQVSDGLEELRAQQTELKRTLARPRGARVARLLLVLLAGVVVGVWSWERWADRVPWLDAWRRGGGAAHVAALLPGGRSDAAGVPTGSAARPGVVEAGLTAVEARALRLRAERAEELLVSAREERNKQLGETVRLRQELVEKQLQMDQLRTTVNEALAGAEARRVLPVPSTRTSEREPAPLLGRVNDALRAAGLPDLQVVEVGRVDDDALRDLLVRDYDRVSGKTDILAMRSAHLSVQDGQVSLVLTPLDATGGAPGEPTTYVLSSWDPQAWAATGLSVPEGFVPVNVVKDALGQLFKYHSYELVSLGGFDGGELRDIVLRQLGAGDEHLRTFRAPRAVVLPEGPELVLYEGVVAEDGIERPFWRGQSRLPLPGSDYAAWLEVTGGPGG